MRAIKGFFAVFQFSAGFFHAFRSEPQSPRQMVLKTQKGVRANMKKLFIASALLAAACGCTSVDVYREGDVNALQYLTDNSSNPYHINYDVGKERVKGKGKSTCWFWFFASDDGRHMTPPGFSIGGLKTAKESATFDAVESAKADTLVGAAYRYTSISEWFGIYKEIDCEVTGFPAFVKSIEMISDRPVLLEKDQQVIRLKNWEKLEQNKKNGLW